MHGTHASVSVHLQPQWASVLASTTHVDTTSIAKPAFVVV